MNKTIIILTLSILLSSYTLNAEEKNYCNDPDTNMEWEALIQEHPNDIQFHALHALRLGLCFKVDRGDNQIELSVNDSEGITLDLQETITIKDGITVKVVKTDRSQVKLGIEAPEDVTINREEVYKKDQVGNA